MIFLSFLLITSLSKIYCEIISQNFNYELDRPIIYLNFHKENNQVYSFINTFHPFTLFIRNQHFKLMIDELILGKKAINLEDETEVIDYKTDVTFEKTLLTGYHIYVYHSHIWYPDQGIGLAYKFEKEEYSLIHLLYKNKAINKKIFGLYFEIKNKKGVISFGGIPSNAHLKYKMKSYCNVNDEYTSWGCNLTSISFNNSTESFNYY